MWNEIFLIIKRKIKVVIIGVLAAALFTGYFIGRVNSSRDRVITKLEISLKEGDLNSLRKLVTVNDKKVLKDDLKPLIKYYSDNLQAVDNVISSLKNGRETSVFTIKEEKGILGNAYNVQLKTYSVKIDSNFTDGKFTINSKEDIYAGESIENVIPGVYTVEGILQSNYGDIESSQEFVLMKDENIQLDFDAIQVTVQSQFKDADLYINDEYTGMTVEEAEEIGPFINDGSCYAYIEKEFPWGTIKGEKEYIEDVPVINLNINVENDKLKSDINDSAEEFYRSIFMALNNEDKSYISNAEEAAKNKVYSILEEKYIFLKNKYSIDKIKIIDDKSEYTYEDNMYKANIIVEVDYSTEKSIFGFNKNESSKKFFTKFVYNEESKEWIASDVENFSL